MKPIYWIIIAVLIIALIVFLVVRYNKNKQKEQAITADNSGLINLPGFTIDPQTGAYKIS